MSQDTFSTIIHQLNELMDNSHFELDEHNFNQFMDKVQKLTDVNNHTEAYIEIAKYFNLTDLIQEFEKIKEYRDRNNGLDYETNQLRYSLYKDMFERIKELIGEEKAQQLRSMT